MAKKVTLELGLFSGKKHSVLFKPTVAVEDPPITGLYLMNSAHAKLGAPRKIAITIENADD